MIRVGVVGAGLIGRERILAVRQLAGEKLPVELVGVCDSDRALLERTAQEFSVPGLGEVEQLLRLEPDWVVVALPHDTALPVASEILKRGHSVLLEKPMGRDLQEARRLLEAGGDRLRVGFNYRFFSGIRQAIQDARRGAFGPLIAIDLVLGHGCSPGQEKTWKLDAERAGGGCLIDPGVHLLDLCLLLAPQSIEIAGANSWSGFWKTGIEEDAQLLLRTGDGVSISVQVSIVRWRSTFSLTIHGVEGYGMVTGRGRSYGPQTYRTGARWGWNSAPSQAASERLVVESAGLDSFIAETRALLFPTGGAEAWPGPCTAADAFAVMELLDRIRQRLALPRHFSQEVTNV
jgi:predicted dehydrogenase